MSSHVQQGIFSRLELTLAAIPENIPVARQALRAMVTRRADPELAGDISTAMTEAAMNSVVHGYPDSQEGEFQVTAVFEGQQLQLEVRDWGSGVRPRPANPNEGLRIGLPLIATMTDEFEIRSGPGSGTLVRMLFELDRDDDVEASNGERPPHDPDETVIKVASDDGIAPSVASALAMLAARTDLSIDRVADVQVLGDLLASAISRDVETGICLRIAQRDHGIEIRVGPFGPGAAQAVVESASLPELGNTFDSLSDEWHLERDDDGELLVIQIGNTAG
jgi:anti-sigma regulatory factor (Ser/Thr protein kinase)